MTASIQSVSIEELRQRTGRKCKTDPLREAVLKMEIGDCLYVPFYDPENAPEGFKANTIIQVVGGLSRLATDRRYSVRQDVTTPGSFVLCQNPRTPEEIAHNVVLRAKRKESAERRAALEESGEAPEPKARKSKKAKPEAEVEDAPVAEDPQP